jgi:adenylate cyclase
VNEAARLCELSKREPSRVLAATNTVIRASASDVAHRFLGEETVLRGRGARIRLAIPAKDAAREEVSGC